MYGVATSNDFDDDDESVRCTVSASPSFFLPSEQSRKQSVIAALKVQTGAKCVCAVLE